MGCDKMVKIKDILIGVGSIFIGSIGVLSIISSFFSSIANYKNDFFSAFGEFIGGSLVGMIFLYLAYRVIKGSGKKEKMVVYASLGFVAVFIIASVSVFSYLEYTEQVGELKTYSNYGLSFEYPEEMIVTNKGVLNDAADDESGLILLENELKNKIVVVSWAYTDQPPSLDGVLKETAEEIKYIEGITDILKGDVVETTKSGHRMIYMPIMYKSYGGDVFGLYGVWYCTDSERMYYLSVETFENTDTTSLLFQRYLDSIVCHFN